MLNSVVSEVSVALAPSSFLMITDARLVKQVIKVAKSPVKTITAKHSPSEREVTV